MFGLGLARTGTTSMHQAIGRLGFRSAPSSARLIDGIDEVFLADHDAFFDNPVPFLRSEWERRFPDARYLITWRPVESWLPSMAWLFGPGIDRLSPAMQELGNRVHREVYGFDRFDADRLTEIHRSHYDTLRHWSVGRHDVLWLDQEAGFTWGPLCEFLQVPVPDEPFPTANAATDKRSDRRFVGRVRPLADRFGRSLRNRGKGR